MTITTISSRDFNQDIGKAKRATINGPVFITDRGDPRHVLLRIEDYEQITNKEESIVELLSMADVASIEFDPPRLSQNILKPMQLN